MFLMHLRVITYLNLKTLDDLIGKIKSPVFNLPTDDVRLKKMCGYERENLCVSSHVSFIAASDLLIPKAQW